MVGRSIGLLTVLIAGAFRFLAIAIAWLVFRPLIDLGLLAIAGGRTYLSVTNLRQPPQEAAIIE